MEASDYSDVCRTAFDYLTEEFGFTYRGLQAQPRGFCTVRFDSESLLVAVVYDPVYSDVAVWMCARARGWRRILSGDRFSRGTRATLDALLEIAVPELIPPPVGWGPGDPRSKVVRTVRHYASAVREHCVDILHGDTRALEAAAALLRWTPCLQRLAGDPGLAIPQVGHARVRPGDVFLMRLCSSELLFGRVITTDARVGEYGGLDLIYVYNARSSSLQPIPSLNKDALLIPPTITTDAMWQTGYFAVVDNRPLTEGDVLSAHCFHDSHGTCYDENAQVRPCAYGRCGTYGIAPGRSLERRISEALEDLSERTGTG